MAWKRLLRILLAISLVASTFQALVYCLGEPPTSLDFVQDLGFHTNMVRESHVVLIKGTFEGLGALGTAAVHLCMYLAALYRYIVLVGSGFGISARNQLRSLPLSKTPSFGLSGPGTTSTC